ncbi:MAG: carboxypeptidase-like regulatory domain-containing protein, partial [Acidobacteriaceae bacterium]
MTLASRLSRRFLAFLRPSALLLLLVPAAALHAVSVTGTVTDPLGRPISGAVVALVHNGQVLKSVRTGNDGTYLIVSAHSGRFYVLASGHSFRQLATQSFYAGALDGIVQNIVLEPEW